MANPGDIERKQRRVPRLGALKEHPEFATPAVVDGIRKLMVLFENVHIGNCRSETRSALVKSPLRSPILLIGVVVAFSIHFLSMHLAPMQKLLGIAPLGLDQWIVLIGLALAIFAAMELHKVSWWLRHRNEPRA